MNILDIILLLCLVWAVVQGLRKGFISQVIAIISIISGVWMSARFTNVVCTWLSQWISGSEQVLKVVAFTLILVAVFLVLAALGKALEGIIRLVMLGWLNKLLGVVFSLLKCLLILGLIVLAFNSLNSTIQLVKPEYLADSILYGPIRDLANSVFPYVKEMITLK